MGSFPQGLGHLLRRDGARMVRAVPRQALSKMTLPSAISGDAKQIRVVYATLRYGHVLIPIGLALLLIGTAGTRARRPDTEATAP
jgi:hypothetical protein